ncbi:MULTISPECIES: hypothetical protein [Streptomyces]|uniref:Uncharacterized protein n=1 Tax=Streptomyces virginiae TaxID=1961 RepID=A0ABZ1T3Y1_STRVG|nr:hypothetical protein [Streptomyces virginiae]WTB20169.1 hypothetical protein OG253_00785 [Streptomyces virginiae]
MQHLGESDSTHTVARDLNRPTVDSSWLQTTGTALVGRLVDVALASLTTPLGAAGTSGPGSPRPPPVPARPPPPLHGR